MVWIECSHADSETREKTWKETSEDMQGLRATCRRCAPARPTGFPLVGNSFFIINIFKLMRILDSLIFKILKMEGVLARSQRVGSHRSWSMADANYFRHLGCWRHFAVSFLTVSGRVPEVGANKRTQITRGSDIVDRAPFLRLFPHFGLYSCTTTAGAETAMGRTSTRTPD
jgi:hypothetical protein